MPSILIWLSIFSRRSGRRFKLIMYTLSNPIVDDGISGATYLFNAGCGTNGGFQYAENAPNRNHDVTQAVK